MGYYKELDIERIHQDEETTKIVASQQITLGEVFAKESEPRKSLTALLGIGKYEPVPESQYN